MRKIKFRVWDGECYQSLSEAIYQGIVGIQHNRKDSFELESYYNFVIIEQFTGLTDMNGKEIYEGDIVEFETEIVDKKEKWLSEIKFKYSAWICISPFGAGDMFIEDMQNDDIVEGIVVGNIHDNPEMVV